MYDCIAQHYGIRFSVGDRVRFTESKPREGVVIRSRENLHYVKVKFDSGEIEYCHPRSLAILTFANK